VAPGKGITFIDVDRVVDAAGRFAVDESLSGRVMTVLPEPDGIVDMREEEEGLWGGEVLNRMVEGRRKVGDII